MVQHALKNNRLFGMAIPTSMFPEIPPTDLGGTAANKEGICDVGTCVRIKEHRTLPDGRIMIEVVGVARMQILELTEVTETEKTTNEPAQYFSALCAVFNDEHAFEAVPSKIDEVRDKVLGLLDKFKQMFPHPMASL